MLPAVGLLAVSSLQRIQVQTARPHQRQRQRQRQRHHTNEPSLQSSRTTTRRSVPVALSSSSPNTNDDDDDNDGEQRRQPWNHVNYSVSPVSAAQHSSSSSSNNNNNNNISLFLDHTVRPIALFLLQSLTAALVLVSWEDYTCTYTLSSRHSRTLLSSKPYSSSSYYYYDENGGQQQSSSSSSSWAARTIHGLAFGQAERQLLLLAAETDNNNNNNDNNNNNNNNNLFSTTTTTTIRSYNEVMLEHRTVTVPKWQQAAYDNDDDETITEVVQACTHTLLECLQMVLDLKRNLGARHYEWNVVRQAIGVSTPTKTMSSSSSSSPSPLANLAAASHGLQRADIRSRHEQQQQYGRQAATTTTPATSDDALSSIIGFDWGSCAYRHCGALADAQEALDEIDHLLGVLEPFEVIFCLDIVERSLRDILAVAVPWEQQLAAVSTSSRSNVVQEAAHKDAGLWRRMPAYEPTVSRNAPNADTGKTAFEDEYMATLHQFRID
jgi:hypothetical protein